MVKESGPKEEAKADERRDAGITRMLNTPPKPHKDMKKGKPPKTGGKGDAKG